MALFLLLPAVWHWNPGVQIGSEPLHWPTEPPQLQQTRVCSHQVGKPREMNQTWFKRVLQQDAVVIPGEWTDVSPVVPLRVVVFRQEVTTEMWDTVISTCRCNINAKEEDSNLFGMSPSPNSRRDVGNSCLGPLCPGLGPRPGDSPLAGSA